MARIVIDAREQAALDEFAHCDEAYRLTRARRTAAMDKLQQVRHELWLEERSREQRCDS